MLDIFLEPYVCLFIIIFIGVLLSQVTIKGIGIGSSGVVIVAMILGHFGLTVPPSVEKIGLILFIFAVGIQAGPGFFESFRTGEARQYLVPVFICLGLAFVLTISLGRMFGLDYLLLGGVFTGIVTSTPAFAAFIENSGSTTPTLTYSIAYPASLLVTILTLKLLPRFMNINLEQEEKNYRKDIIKHYPEVKSSYAEVVNPSLFGKTLKEINFQTMTGAIISRIQLAGEEKSYVPTGDSVLEEGELVKVIGDSRAIESAVILLGKPSDQVMKRELKEEVISVVVTASSVIGKSLTQINMDEVWGAEVSKIRRAGVTLIPIASTRLRYGDKIELTVPVENSEKVIKALGGVESNNIDFLPMSLAILTGVIIGQIPVNLWGKPFNLGVSGGILITTLSLGRVGKTGPVLWSIAGKTNQFLRELGIMFFLCGVGSGAGANLTSAFTRGGYVTLALSCLISILVIVLTAFILTRVFNTNKLKTLGAIAGSLTCAAALPGAKEVNNSNIPLTAYSITYPFALFFTIVLSQLVLLMI